MAKRRAAAASLLAAAAFIAAASQPTRTIVRADEPAKSNWTQRVIPWHKPAPEAQKDSEGRTFTSTTPDVDASRRLRAELDWKRRALVCQKLREIAAHTGDAELERFAERLDQRAWDLYMRHLSREPNVADDDRDAGGRVDLKTLPKGEISGRIYEVRP